MNGEWYFAEAGRQIGPVAFSYVARLAPHQPDLMVWRDGLPTWVPARSLPELAGFMPAALLAPAGPFALPADTYPAPAAAAMPKPRPGRRFMARMFDSYVALWIIGLPYLYISAIYFYQTPADWFELICLISVFMLIWATIEAVITFLFSRTFGKALHGIYFPERLSLSTAWRRSMSVWFRGMGGGFPFFAPVTWLVANRNFRNNGITTWDRNLNITVEYARFGVVRFLVAAIVWAAVVSAPFILIYRAVTAHH